MATWRSWGFALAITLWGLITMGPLGCDASDTEGAEDALAMVDGGTGGAQGSSDAGDAGGFLNTGGTTLPKCRGLLCPGDDYCAVDDVGKCEGSADVGWCRSRPSSCSDLVVPVCGCDGKTYNNRCLASQAAVNVASLGPCSGPPPRACGSRGLQLCPEGQFCYWEPTGSCQRDDRPGVCAAIPQKCTEQQQTVCGCDGKDHANECAAAQLGLSVQWTGPCIFL